MKTTRTKGRHIHKGGTLVIGVTSLQEAFDTMRGGGGLLLDMPTTMPVNKILLVSTDRLKEIAYDMGIEGEETVH